MSRKATKPAIIRLAEVNCRIGESCKKCMSRDLKSLGCKAVPVRLRPEAP